jgi:AsmA protein
LQFEAAVKDGVLNSRQLVGELPFLSLRGDGSIDLGKSTVDMRLVANVRNMPELSQDPLSAELKGKQLPFRISGSIDDPSVSVDWAALLKGEATNLLLDKLGLKSSTADGEQASDSSSSNGAAPDADAEKPSVKEQAQEQAKGLLRGLLEPKKKEQEESDDSDGGG